MAFFLSKKQKQQMRERRRKMKGAESDSAEKKGESDAKLSKKRPRPSEEKESQKSPAAVLAVSDSSESTAAPPQSNVVVVPAKLPAKDTKKFRKEARRKARDAGQDEKLLQFVSEGQSPDPAKPPAKKKKLSFPCINDLLKEEKKEAEKREVVESKEKEEAGLSEEYKAKYLAMDCEMVGIGADGKKSALARVSVTDWHGMIVLDTFVKVPAPVTDFRTWVSGVTAKHIKSDEAMDEIACRRKVASLLRGKILVGHALKNDLDALLLQHPKQDIRDTAKYRPYQRLGNNKWRPRKLRDLALQHVNLVIQEKGQSHDSTDDARATMELFKVTRASWERELESKARRNRLHK